MIEASAVDTFIVILLAILLIAIAAVVGMWIRDRRREDAAAAELDRELRQEEYTPVTGVEETGPQGATATGPRPALAPWRRVRRHGRHHLR